MKLYFENLRKERRIIAEPNNESEVYEEIRKFCEERNFTIYYTRMWRDNDNLKVYDVGSHTEFFLLDDN